MQSDALVQNLFSVLSDLPTASIEPGGVHRALSGLGELPGFLRALLVADGTVTMALEAFFGEVIRIQTIRQGPLPLPVDLPALDMAAGDTCFFREVYLEGESSGRRYGHATSVLNKQAITPGLFDQLVDEHVGIGIILRNAARGSFREVLRIANGPLMANGEVNRTYRVSLNGTRSILISEEFPLAPYLAPEPVTSLS